MDQVTKDQALKVLKEEREQRILECQHAINELLRKYGCDLVAQPSLTADGRVVATVRLVDASGK